MFKQAPSWIQASFGPGESTETANTASNLLDILDHELAGFGNRLHCRLDFVVHSDDKSALIDIQHEQLDSALASKHSV